MTRRKDDLNYKLFYLINPRSTAAIKDFITKITASDGFKHGATTYHAKINAETGFYQVVE